MPMKLFPLFLRQLLNLRKKSEIYPRNNTSIAKMISYFGDCTRNEFFH